MKRKNLSDKIYHAIKTELETWGHPYLQFRVSALPNSYCFEAWHYGHRVLWRIVPREIIAAYKGDIIRAILREFASDWSLSLLRRRDRSCETSDSD